MNVLEDSLHRCAKCIVLCCFGWISCGVTDFETAVLAHSVCSANECTEANVVDIVCFFMCMLTVRIVAVLMDKIKVFSFTHTPQMLHVFDTALNPRGM